jgi:hypothetical protein
MMASQNQAWSLPVGSRGIFSHMQCLGRNRTRGIALPVAAMALMLGSCGSMERLSDLTPRSSDLLSFEWNPYSKASTSIPSTFTRQAATPADYVNADGSCAATAAEGSSEQTVAGGVALQMTECAVVRVLGAPEKVDIGANERGERTTQLLYSRGDRPGRYYFAAGLLTQVERVAEPAPAAKPKKPAAKPRRAAT